jgi:hypothetical protein
VCKQVGAAAFGCDALSLEVRVDLATTAGANRVDLIFTRSIDNMIGSNNSQCMAVVRCRALILVCVHARGCTKLRQRNTKSPQQSANGSNILVYTLLKAPKTVEGEYSI